MDKEAYEGVQKQWFSKNNWNEYDHKEEAASAKESQAGASK